MTTTTELEYQTFVDRIEGEFTLCWPDGGRPFSARLVECQAAPSGPQSFSLLFRAEADSPVQQGCFLLSAVGIEPAPIFLVPITSAPGYTDYQAVFNRIDARHPHEGAESE